MHSTPDDDGPATEEEKSEAAGLLAQVTSPWIENNCSIEGLSRHLDNLVSSLTGKGLGYLVLLQVICFPSLFLVIIFKSLSIALPIFRVIQENWDNIFRGVYTRNVSQPGLLFKTKQY